MTRQYSDKLEIIAGDDHIASVTTDKRKGITPEREANARLITVAPNMFWALSFIVEAHDAGVLKWSDETSWVHPISQARAALAKARGEQ